MKFCVPLLLIALLSACSYTDDKTVSLEVPENAVAIQKEDGTLELVNDASKIKKKLTSFMVNRVDIFDTPLSDGDVEIKNFVLEKSGEDKAYIIYTLYAKGKAVNVAHELTQGADGFYSSFGNTHACKGEPCSDQSFQRNEANEIVGCNCNDVGGFSNHTISNAQLSSL